MSCCEVFISPNVSSTSLSEIDATLIVCAVYLPDMYR